MSDEVSEKLINILSNISDSVIPVPFSENYAVWFSILSTIALIVTLYFLIKYTHATENIAKYQLTPAIDVNMIYDQEIKLTYFWFSNDSNLPGIVYLEFKKNNENRKKLYQPLRIPPKRKMKTATTFDFSPINGDKMTIYISIRLALEKSIPEVNFEKSYVFGSKGWNEASWSYPDPSFPV